MKKSTERVEKIIAGLKAVRAMMRQERIEGMNCEHMEHDLELHEIAWTARLLELREHNQRIEAQAGAAKAAPEKNSDPR